ncbi:MAG: cupin domain-containing protein [Chloroflexi bacterium]|nr:cupin domain-containing protein [Chloroflexota bacterium]
MGDTNPRNPSKERVAPGGHETRDGHSAAHRHTAKAVRALGQPTEIPTRPGMYRRRYVGPDDGVHELFVEELTFQHGAAIPLHHHPVVESFVVVDGSLTFRLGDETLDVEAERTVTIPPNTLHAVVNEHQNPARAICAAPWDHDTFYRAATTYLEGEPRD